MTRLALMPSFTLVLSLLAGACALETRYPEQPSPTAPGPVAEDEIAHRLILIGDAGDAEPDDFVLAELWRVAGELDGARTTIVFLGDNIYPDGVPPANGPGYDNAKSRLKTQIEAAIANGAATAFLPGNHDYGGDGDAAVIRQAKYIRALSDGAAEMIPRGTCPGPIVRDIGRRLRMVYLDSEWLVRQSRLHPCAEGDPNSSIDPSQNIYDALSVALSGAGDRLVVIAFHHPLTTYGQHGGFFPWQVHLFPLWNEPSLRGTPVPYLLPLPLLPTLVYVTPRQAGLYTKDDLAHRSYRSFIDAFDAVLRRHPEVEVLLASGHEHNLQILTYRVADAPDVLQILSGSGTVEPPSPVGVAENTVMASPRSGFVVLDVLKRDVSKTGSHALIEVVEIETPTAGGEVPARPTLYREFRMWVPPRRPPN